MTLFIANLNFNIPVCEEDLRKIFESFGKITRIQIMRNLDGKSRGFGFIDFENDDDGFKAMSELAGTEFCGRPLYVSVAREKRWVAKL